MSTYLLIDHNNNDANGSNFKAMSAAKALGSDVIAVVMGHQCQEVANQAAQIEGVSKVLLADHEGLVHQPAEAIAPALVALMGEGDHLVAASSTVTRNILPRVAAKLDVMQVSDLIEVIDPKTFVRPIYAGNAMQTVTSQDKHIVATIRATAFPAVGTQDGTDVETLDVSSSDQNQFVGEELSKSDRPELTAAKIVISGGRGMQNGENFAMLEKVADKLGAAIGASRAAVDAGYVPNDYQVGQTGKVVAPELYIAVGISGAIQHLAGMKDSKVIVAINKDEEAPIYQVADYGLVADLFQAVPELEEKL